MIYYAKINNIIIKYILNHRFCTKIRQDLQLEVSIIIFFICKQFLSHLYINEDSGRKKIVKNTRPGAKLIFLIKVQTKKPQKVNILHI